MGIKKHDTRDDVSGISKPVQKAIAKEARKQAQEQKTIDQKHFYSKAGKYNGNAGTR